MANDNVNKINAAILDILAQHERDNETSRSNMLTKIKEYELKWRGIADYYWDATVKDWRIPEVGSKLWLESRNENYNHIVNIQQAHGEAIIAALSVDTPKVTFMPEDARNPNDLLAASAFQKIGALIQRDNDASLLQMNALFTLFNQGIVGAYNYYEYSQDYGTDLTLVTKTKPLTTNIFVCPVCGFDGLENNAPQVCPNCESFIEPRIEENTQEIPVEQLLIPEPRGRIVLEMYGLMNVSIPHYVKKQKDIGVCVLEFEQHSSAVKSVYGDKVNDRAGSTDEAREIRLSMLYDAAPQNLLTVKKVWIRPWMYFSCPSDTRKLLEKRYPEGIRAVVVDDNVVDVRSESIDYHWTFTEVPTSNTLISDPKAGVLAPIQDLTTLVKNLTAQTIEYGIPFTIADPEVFDFNKFAATRSRPGDFFPGKSAVGKNYGESFYTIKPASMSQEIKEFTRDLQQDGQFAIGSFPSIYGGVIEGGSKTLGEYNASRAQALQRLGISWKVLNHFWANMIHKSSIVYARMMKDDYKDTQKQGGNFVTTLIRRAELAGGRIGRAVPESADVFPLTWAQKRDVIMSLLQLKDQQIAQVLYHPENVDYVATAVGLPDLFIPGRADRIKQNREIQELIKQGPIEQEQDPMQMDDPDLGPQPPSMEPSIPIDPDIDDDTVHIEVLQSFLISEEGQVLRVDNEEAYANCLAHLKAHQMNLQNKQMEQMQMGGDSGQQFPPNKKPEKKEND